jgi:hypothetical protein
MEKFSIIAWELLRLAQGKKISGFIVVGAMLHLIDGVKIIRRRPTRQDEPGPAVGFVQ